MKDGCSKDSNALPRADDDEKPFHPISGYWTGNDLFIDSFFI